jgi:hypothetical protein
MIKAFTHEVWNCRKGLRNLSTKGGIFFTEQTCVNSDKRQQTLHGFAPRCTFYDIYAVYAMTRMKFRWTISSWYFCHTQSHCLWKYAHIAYAVFKTVIEERQGQKGSEGMPGILGDWRKLTVWLAIGHVSKSEQN